MLWLWSSARDPKRSASAGGRFGSHSCWLLRMKESVQIVQRLVAWTKFTERQKSNMIFRRCGPNPVYPSIRPHLYLTHLPLHPAVSLRAFAIQIVDESRILSATGREGSGYVVHPHPRRLLSNNKLHQICTISPTSSPPSSSSPSPFQLHNARRVTKSPQSPAPPTTKICHTRKNFTKASARLFIIGVPSGPS